MYLLVYHDGENVSPRPDESRDPGISHQKQHQELYGGQALYYHLPLLFLPFRDGLALLDRASIPMFDPCGDQEQLPNYKSDPHGQRAYPYIRETPPTLLSPAAPGKPEGDHARQEATEDQRGHDNAG